MKNIFEEEFDWIPDEPKWKTKPRRDEESYCFNREFVKAFGLKSDCVGWCTLKGKNLNRELLEAIRQKADDEKMHIRGCYTLKVYRDAQSRWYRLLAKPGMDDYELDWGKTNCFLYFHAYKYKAPVADLHGHMVMREDLVRVMEQAGITGYRKYWAPDRGRFKAKQYYQIFPDAVADRYFGGRGYNEKMPAKKQIDKAKYLGLVSETIWEICDEVQMVHLPDSMSLRHLPEGDIAELHGHIIVSSRLRNIFLSQKVMSKSDFEAVPIFDNDFDNPPAGWFTQQITGREEEPTAEIVKRYEKEYAQFLKKDRPERKITEKLATAELRRDKRLEPEFFNNGLRGAKLDMLPSELLKPYYMITNGGALADEYQLCCAEELEELQQEYLEEQALEELCPMPDGALTFAVCSDGERIMLLPDERVVRYAMGDPDFVEEWDNLHCFIYDVLQLNDMEE